MISIRFVLAKLIVTLYFISIFIYIIILYELNKLSFHFIKMVHYGFPNFFPNIYWITEYKINHIWSGNWI